MCHKKMDQKKTMIVMKKEMMFLKQYSAQLRLHSVLYHQDHTTLQVEDGLLEYLHYTTSILRCTQAPKQRKDVYLEAMQRQEKKQQEKSRQEQRAYVLLQGIHQLSLLEEELLFDLFVRNYERKVIMLRQGDIVESTLRRRMNRALMKLAVLLCMEVYEVNNEQE